MGLHYGNRIPTQGLVFLIDPANSQCWNGSTLTDLVGGKVMTKGANTVFSTTYNSLGHFSSSAGEEGTGALDTGYRYGSAYSGDYIVRGDLSFTAGLWIYKNGPEIPNNWWHVITDGESGDILTLTDWDGSFQTSMNNGIGGSDANGNSFGFAYPGVSWSTLDTNKWNLLGVVFDKSNARIKAFCNETIGGWVSQTVNDAYKLRNFAGWGSSQSSYHSDPSHSISFAYNTALNDAQLMQIYNAQKTRFGR